MDLYLNLASKLPVIVLILLAASGVITGDYFAKSWSESRETWRWFVSIFGYICSGVFYIPTLLREQLIVTSIIWSVLSIFGFLVIGFFIFKETFNTIQIAGIVFGIVSLALFALSNH